MNEIVGILTFIFFKEAQSESTPEYNEKLN